MNILAFSDIHNEQTALDFIIEKINHGKPDLLLISGDVTTFGPEGFAVKFFNSIPIKSFSVPGNCDPSEIHSLFNKGNSTNIHGKAVEYSGFRFVGWGGSNISGLNTPFETEEAEIQTQLDPVIGSLENGDRNAKGALPMILVSHCPPFGITDLIPRINKHIGCTSIADIVEKYRPVLTVSGHVHEAQGVHIDEKRKLYVVNVGPAKENCGAVITLDIPDKVIEDPLKNIKIELFF